MNTGNCPDNKQIQNIGLILFRSESLSKSVKHQKRVNSGFQVNYFCHIPSVLYRLILLFVLPDVQCNLFQEQFIRDLIDYYRMVKRWKNVKSNEKASRHVKTS